MANFQRGTELSGNGQWLKKKPVIFCRKTTKTLCGRKESNWEGGREIVVWIKFDKGHPFLYLILFDLQGVGVRLYKSAYLSLVQEDASTSDSVHSLRAV